MPSPRWLPVFVCALLLLTGCRQSPLQQRAEEIRNLSDREDRMYTSEALNHIKHRYWTVIGRTWYGKSANGKDIRLRSIRVSTAPMPTYFRGWHLLMTVASDDWSLGSGPERQEPFEAVYAITRYSTSNWDIHVNKGPETSPLHGVEAARLQLSDN